MAPLILNELKLHAFNPKRVCPLLKLCRKSYLRIKIKALVKNIVADKPKNQPQPQPTLKKIYKLMQITDVHTDPEYLPYSNANCNYPLCCRN